MRYLTLSEVEETTREEAVENPPHARQPMPAPGLWLSHQGHTIEATARLYKGGRDTVARWFTRGARSGSVGLHGRVRSGRPEKPAPQAQARLRQLLEVYPRATKRIAAVILEEPGKTASVDTLERIGKKARLGWKRIRRSLKDKRNPQAFEQGKEEMNTLRARHDQDAMDRYFFDASGVSLTRVSLMPGSRSARSGPHKKRAAQQAGLSLALRSFGFEGSVATPAVIACFDGFWPALLRPTGAVLDKAPRLPAMLLRHGAPTGTQPGFFSILYRPELNLIDMLWRFIQYRWLPRSYRHLKEALDNILAHFGEDYRIIFSEVPK